MPYHVLRAYVQNENIINNDNLFDILELFVKLLLQTRVPLQGTYIQATIAIETNIKN